MSTCSVNINFIPSRAYSKFEPSYDFVTSSPSQDERFFMIGLMNEKIRKAIVEAKISEGYEVTRYAMNNLQRFFRLLPDELLNADVYISDKGSIVFDWEEDSQNQLSIMLQDNNRIGYSAYLKGDRTNGSTAFNNASLPEEINLFCKKWIKNNSQKWD